MGDPQYRPRAGLSRGRSRAQLLSGQRACQLGGTDEEALDGFRLLSVTEGIIPALESSPAVYYAATLAAGLARDQLIVVNLSGRGDKDLDIVAGEMGIKL